MGKSKVKSTGYFSLTTFDKEVVSEKYPVDLTFDFPIPYTTCMEVTKGSEYLQKIKDALRSEEYQSYTFPTRPYIVKFAELKSLSHINSCFPDNKNFGNTLEKIVLQEFDIEHIKSLCKFYLKDLLSQCASRCLQSSSAL